LLSLLKYKIRPAEGIPAAPILANVAVMLNFLKALKELRNLVFSKVIIYLVTTKSINDNGISFICAIKIEATASYSAVPSRFT